MIKGWEEGFQIPCADHTMELLVNLYTQHARLSPTFVKGRGLVGYFNSSVVTYNETEIGLHSCQKLCGKPEHKITQDVKTRWCSTHAMAESLLLLILCDAKNKDAAKKNRYSI